MCLTTPRRSVLFLSIILCFPHFLKAQSQEDRFEAGVVFSGISLREIGSTDSGVGTSAGGVGGRFVYRIHRYLDIDADLIVLPGPQATTGNRIQGFAGIKTGWRSKKAGVFLKTRPGFIHFGQDPFGVFAPSTSLFSSERASSTEPSLDLGVVAEYYTSRNLILRFDFGDTVIRYGSRATPTGAGGGFTTHNKQGSFGIDVRF